MSPWHSAILLKTELEFIVYLLHGAKAVHLMWLALGEVIAGD